MADLLPKQPGLPIRDPDVIILILASAALYVGSMIIMKLWDSYPAGLMAVGIALCLSGAIWFEILALRQARLSMVYVAMLGAEAIMLAAVARFGFGEALMPREIAGATLIIIGTLVAAG
jgi:multidrug transporter EmrE-like cation transporter